MSDCIFCKIVSGEMPATIIEESEGLIAIKDVHPQAPVHLLIMPKRHFRSLLECDDEALLGRMLSMAKGLAEEQGVAAGGFRVLINTNKDGGQTVFHLHMHLLAGRQLAGEMG